MKDENNVIETKTEKENKMSDTTKEIEKESNVILSKLSEEQFNSVGNNPSQSYYGSLRFDGFYPTLNTELLTLIREDFNWNQKYGRNVDLTEDEFISIVKDYGSVSHYRDEVRVITMVNVSLPEPEELLPEKLVA